MALHPLTWRVDRFSGVREGRNATSKAGDVSQAAAVSDSRASLRMGMEHYPGTGPLARMKPLHLLNELHNGAQRSEEHTSELQSLMRISYAVVFLKKNTHK